MAKVSAGSIKKLQKKYNSALARARRMKDEAESIAGQVQGAATVGATAFGLGYAQHRFRGDDGQAGIEILGVPLDLGVAIGMHVGVVFGLFGKHSDMAKDVGNGALAAYATTMGAGLGTKGWQEQQSGGAAPADASASGTRSRMRDLAGY